MCSFLNAYNGPKIEDKIDIIQGESKPLNEVVLNPNHCSIQSVKRA